MQNTNMTTVLEQVTANYTTDVTQTATMLTSPPGVSDHVATSNYSFANLSVDSEHELQMLNAQKALLYIPVIVFVAMLMIIGIVGNLLVVYIYYWKFKKTSSNYFILSMAVFDLLACSVGMPTELYDLMFHYTFYSSIGCKMFRYVESVTVYASVIILVEIAFDRYFKICKPLKVVDLYRIKCMCLSAAIAALAMASPAIVLFGLSRSAIPEATTPGLVSSDCSIEEKYKKSLFAKIFYACLVLVFVVVLVILTVLYIRIWIEIKRRKHMVIGDQVSTPNNTEVDGNLRPKKPRIKYIPSVSDDDSSGTSTNRSITRQNSIVKSQRFTRMDSIAEVIQRIKVSRTTVILFVVTVVFVLSYLPSIVVMSVRSSVKGLEDNQGSTAELLSKLFGKFYFINNAINPIIYSFLNVNFRRHCFQLFNIVFCCAPGTIWKRAASFSSRRGSRSSQKSVRSNNSLQGAYSSKEEVV